MGAILSNEQLGVSRQATALVVDDDTFIHDYFSELLHALDITDVQCCRNGKIALRTMATLPQPPDFLICDVFMPDMDGIEFLAELVRLNYQGGVILVSGLDASMLDMSRTIALHRGLNVWGAFCKPLPLATLSATLKSHGIVA